MTLDELVYGEGVRFIMTLDVYSKGVRSIYMVPHFIMTVDVYSKSVRSISMIPHFIMTLNDDVYG